MPSLPGSQHDSSWRDIVWPVARNCILWGLLHSLLAALPAKRAAEQMVGSRKRNGLYRVFYNVVAWVSFGWLVRSIVRLPNKEIYRVQGPLHLVLRTGRIAAAAVAAWSGLILGPLRFNGVPQLLALLQGKEPPPEDEAQGPIREDGRLKVVGPFRVSRHPANWGFALIALLSSSITVKGLTITALTVLYAALGSLHEDHRLRARYGSDYQRYRQEVPFGVSTIVHLK